MKWNVFTIHIPLEVVLLFLKVRHKVYPHISMSAGVVVKSAAASCCPRSGEPVSSSAMTPGPDTLVLMLQNTHRNNGTSAAGLKRTQVYTCVHIFPLYWTRSQRSHPLCRPPVQGTLWEIYDSCSQTGHPMFFLCSAGVVELHIYVTCFGNLEGSVHFTCPQVFKCVTVDDKWKNTE